MILRHLGPEMYETAIRWPTELITAAIDAARQREAERRLDAVEDLSMAAGLKLGSEYIDPKSKGKKADPQAPYYSLERLQEHQALLRDRATGERDLAAARRRRRDADRLKALRGL